jgi:endoglycosylceramidase
MRALLVSWDHFWSNSPAAADGIGLQDHFATAAAHVASELASIDGLLGYEVLNEPWPGTPWLSCLISKSGCDAPDAALTAFNRRVAPAIRAVDAEHLVFAEPYSTFNDGFPTSIGALNDANGGFAFHVYCFLAGADGSSELPGAEVICPPMERAIFDHADQHVAATQEALLMTEFGATPDTRVITRVTADADAHMTSWMWWTYNEGTGLDPSQSPPDKNLNPAVANLLVRAYPRAIAGTPQSWSFDPDSKTFTLSYTLQRADGSGTFGTDATTEIYLPQRQYPKGYKVSVTGGNVQSAAGATLLDVTAQPGVQVVQVTVSAIS